MSRGVRPVPGTRAPAVAVVGPRDAGPELRRSAQEVGHGLGELGCVVVTGGGGGVMAAANEGARRSGGTTVAFLPGDDPAALDAVLDFVDVVVPTGLGEGRDLLVVRTALVVVAVGGSWGTLAEVALARRAGTPVVAVAGWTVHDAAGEPVPDGVTPAADAAEALRLTRQLLTGRRDR